jgi:hypothetical protein
MLAGFTSGARGPAHGRHRGAGDLGQDRRRHPAIERPRGEPRSKVGALDQAHGDEEHPIGLVGLVDGQDVGVVDGGRHLRLAQEPGAGLGIVAELGRDDLERHLAAQAGLLGEVDDAHPATADDGLDPVRSELGAEARVGTGRGHGWMNRAVCSNQS